MIVKNQRTYFAARNTSMGFRSDFDSIFDAKKWNHVYIIKGGPGTGKSSFLRRVSAYAREKGWTVDDYLCSSDSNSLDGVLIYEKGIALLDGTSPHTMDPILPGATDQILNFGDFWHRDVLIEQKLPMLRLIQAKSRHYKRAYRFLNSMGKIAEEIRLIGTMSLDEQKMLSNVQRICRRELKQGNNFSAAPRNISAINQNGVETLDTFESQSQTVYVIEDTCYTAHNYLKALCDMARAMKEDIFISYSCLFPDLCNALYFPARRCAFVIGKRDYAKEKQGKTYRYINMARFVDSSVTCENRQKIRFAKKCCDMLLDGAAEAFKEASQTHSQLEEIYRKAMDFTALNQFTEKFLKSVFE